MGKSNPAEGSQKRTREDRVSDEAYFDANPNAARFREMARRLLSEPGATKEGVRKELEGYGADEEALDHIFRAPHQPQQEEQMTAGGEGISGDALNQKKAEALSALIEERKKGNKGAKILKDLKKLGLPEEEIAEIDKSAGEPGKRSRKAQAQDPAFVDTQPEGEEENLRRNAAYILQERAQGKSDDAIAAEIREGGWDADELAEMFRAANNAAVHMPVQAVSASPEAASADTPSTTPTEATTGRTRGERPPRYEDYEVIRRDAVRVVKDREAGKTDKEITKLMEEAGLSAEAITRRFSMAESIAKSKEKKVLQQNVDAVIWGRQAKISEEEITERLKSVGWKDEDVRKILLLADQRPLPEQFELPEFELAKRYFDPLRKYLKMLAKDPNNHFRIGDARPRYGIGLAPVIEKEGAKITWTSVPNFHDFMRRIWDMPEAERSRLRTTLFTDKPFQNRMDDEKDPLHAYKREWTRLVGLAVRPRSSSERLADDYARAAWRGDVFLEVPQENWDELAHNGDDIAAPEDALAVPEIEAMPPEVSAPAGFEVSESDLLNGLVFDADRISEAFRLEAEEQQTIDANIAARHAPPVDTRPAEEVAVVHSPVEEEQGVDAHAVRNPYRPDLVEQAEEDDRIEVPKPKEGLSVAEVAENRGWNERVDHVEHLRQLKDELEAELEHTTDETTRQHLSRSLEEARRQYEEALAERLGAEERSNQLRIDKELAAYQKDGWVQDMPPVEGTPKEWHERLKSLLEAAKEGATATKEKAKGAAAATKEKVKWWKSAEAGLIRRREELDAEGEKFGWVEGKFRALGERYNKLGWKTKLAVGAALGLGAIASAASFPTALVFISGIATQRVAGLSTMYLKFEKSILDKEGETRWTKEKAMSKALLYTVAFGLAEKEAITLASESGVGQATQRWLADHWPFGSNRHADGISKQEHGSSGAAPAPMAPASHPVGAASAPQETAPPAADAASAASAPAAEAAPAAPADAASTPAQAASQPAGEAAPAAPAEAASAAEAPAQGAAVEIPNVDIAASKGHGYEYMAKRLWEQLQEKHVTLPANANQDSDFAALLRATPENIDTVVHTLAQNHHLYNPDGTSVVIGLDSHMTLDASGNISVSNVDMSHVSEAPGGTYPEPTSEIRTVEVPNAMPSTSGNIDVPVDPSATDYASMQPTDMMHGGNGSHDIAAAGIEHQPPAPVTDRDFIVNKFDVTVPVSEPHIYADGTTFYVYGGTEVEQSQKMLAFLQKNPLYTVLSGETSGTHRVPWKLVDGKLVQGAPLQTNGFLGLGKTYLTPPSPDLFKKTVD